MFIDKLERRISQNSSEGGGDNEDDFFDHDSHKVATIEEVSAQKNNIDNGTACKPELDDGVAPSVEAALTMSPTQAQESLGTRKPTIGQRKPAKKEKVSLEMVRCDTCGVNIPKSEAIGSEELWFCSEEHRT